MHALICRQIQSVARLDVEGRVPGVDIPHDSVGAVFRRTVGIGDELLTQGAFAGLGLPRLRVREEEALISAQAVDDGGFAVLGLIPFERSVPLPPSRSSLFTLLGALNDLEAGARAAVIASARPSRIERRRRLRRAVGGPPRQARARYFTESRHALTR